MILSQVRAMGVTRFSRSIQTILTEAQFKLILPPSGSEDLCRRNDMRLHLV